MIEKPEVHINQERLGDSKMPGKPYVKVTAGLLGYDGKVEVDDKDISHAVYAIDVNVSAAGVTTAKVSLYADEVELLAELREAIAVPKTSETSK